MISADEIRDIAAVFELAGSARSEDELEQLTTEAPADTRAGMFFALLKKLDGRDVPSECRDIGFFRFFVVNGLLQAQRLRFDLRMYALRAIGVGLHEFADYFAHLENRSSDSLYSAIARDEKRYFAFCIAQLIELGFEMDGLLMTMKGDAYDQGDALELRRLREDGPDAFAESFLFDAREKTLFGAVFRQDEAGAIDALQRYFVDTYEVPFLPAPEIAADA
ncbi:MAG: hypothetical protein ACAI38_24765 [Myxococcota bacterium]|nr:hypothetical protein [Myxococcota bacterium]